MLRKEKNRYDINQIRQLCHVWLIEDSSIDIFNTSSALVFFFSYFFASKIFFRCLIKMIRNLFFLLLVQMMSAFLCFFFLYFYYLTIDCIVTIDSHLFFLPKRFYAYGLSSIRWSGNINTWVFRLLVHTSIANNSAKSQQELASIHFLFLFIC